MTDLLRHTPEMLQAPQSRPEADFATDALPLGAEKGLVELAVESQTGERLIKDPDTFHEITLFAGSFLKEIDNLLEKTGVDVPGGSWCVATRARNDLLRIATQDEAVATAILHQAWKATEELAKCAPLADVVPEPTNRGIPLESTPPEELPDPLTVVSALSSWHKQNPKADAELRKSVEWTRDALNHSAPKARLRDGAFLLEVTKELE